MRGLGQLPASAIEAIASGLSITDHTTGERSPWVLNAEQRRICAALEQPEWLFLAKPRQIGGTVIVTLDDVLWTAKADAAGNRVKCAIVVDTDDKTRERMLLAADFAQQLGLVFESSTERIVFPNRSEIVGLTAGGKRAGASISYQRLHLSELPFWPDPSAYASLMPTLSLGGRAIVETTLDITAPSGALARNLWRAPNQFAKLFFSVEDHYEYRRDASMLTAEWEARLRGEHFTNREAMSWWVWAVENLCGGDVVRCFREYPQREEHMFQANESRWISVTPAIRSASRIWPLPGDTAARVFREPGDTSGQLLLGVDTAAGKEKDRSTIAVIDKRDSALCLSLVSDKVSIDDLSLAVRDIVHAYRREDKSPMPGLIDPDRRTPLAIVESNGVGEATYQNCQRLGVPVTELRTDEASRYEGMLLAKRMIESGKISGPPELAEECDECHRDDLGRFKGKKDLLMAIGFALRHLRIAPYIDKQQQKKPQLVNGAERIRRLTAGSNTW